VDGRNNKSLGPDGKKTKGDGVNEIVSRKVEAKFS
jgi:hypothetical protein